MKVTVKTHMDPARIMARRGLQKGGPARRYLAETVRRRCDRYVPYDTGRLKNTARIAGDGSAVIYTQPYAASQFYLPWRHRDPLRGDHWHRRMLAAERNDLVREMGLRLKGGGA